MLNIEYNQMKNISESYGKFQQKIVGGSRHLPTPK